MDVEGGLKDCNSVSGIEIAQLNRPDHRTRLPVNGDDDQRILRYVARQRFEAARRSGERGKPLCK